MGMTSYIQDLGIAYGTQAMKESTQSNNRKKDNTTLDMTDFLVLMVTQMQNQTMDNAADTSDMLNQLVQMQMVTAMTNMTDASIMSYAASLVGKEVTIGIPGSNGKVEEIVVTITGTGVSNGEQVVFAGDATYKLSSIMCVGRLPKKEEETPGEGDKPVDGTDKPGEGNGNTDKQGEVSEEDQETLPSVG